ncbi:MAG: cytidylate kinase-like family protein [Oscillospiraceae bacterium]|nr:cytidylate kinase-like family protein [Oscillospiraceae bacterium]
MEKFLLTISREYGSGGRIVGKKLAQDLEIPFYDDEIRTLTAQKSGLSEEFIAKSAENLPNTFLHNLNYSAYSSYDSISFYDIPVTDKLFLAQAEVIKELAEKGSCVIVGRCADFVLRDNPALIKVMLRGDPKDRISYAVEHYELSPEKAAEKLKKIDKSRNNYYKYYTNRRWANLDNFDLVINTSFTGIDGAVSIIKTMLREKKDIK